MNISDSEAKRACVIAPELLLVRSKPIMQASAKILTSQFSICTPSQLQVKVLAQALLSRCILRISLPSGILDTGAKVVIRASDSHGFEKSTETTLAVERSDDAENKLTVSLPVLNLEDDALVCSATESAGDFRNASSKHLTARKEFVILIPVRSASPISTNVHIAFEYAYLLPSLAVSAGLGLEAYSNDSLDEDGSVAAKILTAIQAMRGKDAETTAASDATLSQILASDDSLCIPVASEFSHQVEFYRHVRVRLSIKPSLALPKPGQDSATLVHPYTLLADVCNLSDTALLHMDSLALAVSFGADREEVVLPSFKVYPGTSRVLMKELSLSAPISGLHCALNGLAEAPEQETCKVSLSTDFEASLRPTAIRQSIHVSPRSGDEPVARSAPREHHIYVSRPCVVEYVFEVSPMALRRYKEDFNRSSEPLKLRLAVPQGEDCNVVGGTDVGLDDVLKRETQDPVMVTKTVMILWTSAGRKLVPEYRMMLGDEEIGGSSLNVQDGENISLSVPRSSVLSVTPIEVIVEAEEA